MHLHEIGDGRVDGLGSAIQPESNLYHVEMTNEKSMAGNSGNGAVYGLCARCMADEVFKFEDFFKMADTNKDGMMTKQEFMNAAGMRYDAMMAKMKKMPGDKGKMMMKGDMMTKEGAKMFIDEWKVYSGA